jgi:hypothetical protein
MGLWKLLGKTSLVILGDQGLLRVVAPVEEGEGKGQGPVLENPLVSRTR